MDTAIVSPIPIKNLPIYCAINIDSSSCEQTLTLGHNCFNWMHDALCKAWKDYCFYDGINYGSTTWRTYMKDRCQKTCGYCSGKLAISAV